MDGGRGHAAAEGVAGDDRVLDADLGGEVGHPVGVAGEGRVLPGQGCGPAEAGQRGGDDSGAAGQELVVDPAVGAVGQAPAVEEEDRQAVARVRKGDAATLDVDDPGPANHS